MSEFKESLSDTLAKHHSEHQAKCVRDQLQAIMSLLASEGLQITPIEPTHDMRVKGYEVDIDFDEALDARSLCDHELNELFKAMSQAGRVML